MQWVGHWASDSSEGRTQGLGRDMLTASEITVSVSQKTHCAQGWV